MLRLSLLPQRPSATRNVLSLWPLPAASCGVGAVLDVRRLLRRVRRHEGVARAVSNSPWTQAGGILHLAPFRLRPHGFGRPPVDSLAHELEAQQQVQLAVATGCVLRRAARRLGGFAVGVPVTMTQILYAVLRHGALNTEQILPWSTRPPCAAQLNWGALLPPPLEAS
jgi:hypothetical protein